MHLLRRAGLFILAIAVLACLGLVIYFALLHNPDDYYSEFYLLDKNGQALNYPSHVATGSPATVTIGVVNRGPDSLDYTIRVSSGGAMIKSINTGKLEPGQKWELKTDITAGEVKGGRVEFYLYSSAGEQLQIKQPLVLAVEAVQ